MKRKWMKLKYTRDKGIQKEIKEIVKTILVFDEYPNMLEAFDRFLSQDNFRVITIDKLERALGIIKILKVDLVILDTGKKSERDVLRVLNVINEINEYLPVVLTATYTDTLTEDTAREMGAEDIILKPFDPQDLKRIINKLVQGNLCS